MVGGCVGRGIALVVGILQEDGFTEVKGARGFEEVTTPLKALIIEVGRCPGELHGPQSKSIDKLIQLPVHIVNHIYLLRKCLDGVLFEYALFTGLFDLTQSVFHFTNLAHHVKVLA
jgi:hypothetical protein